MPQLVPGEAAIDEKYRAIRKSLRSRGGAYGVRRLADQQRFVTGDQVHAGHAPGQSSRQLFRTQAQFMILARAAA
jgi:hypothetical protein